MATVRKYQEDVCRKEDHLRVKEVIDSEVRCRAAGLKFLPGTILVELEATIFYPEGGGQPCDLGTLDGIPVIDVFEHRETETVYHRLVAEPDAHGVAAGAVVHCVLDWDRRLTHMQIHSAEHLVSGLIWERYGGINKGFRMGKDYATIDILLPADAPEPAFSQEMIDGLELAANRAVWENTEVVTDFCTTREAAAAHPLRKPLALDEGITVVTIGESGNVYDCCACCGTHVPRTGGIGSVKLLKTENYKGMTRITLTAGLPAYRDTALRQKITAVLCARHSTEIDGLMGRIDVQERKNGAARKELYDLKKDLLREEEQKLTKEWSGIRDEKEAHSTPSVRIYRYGRYSTDDLQTLGRTIEKTLPGPVALISEPEMTAVLLSGGIPNCGELVRDYASVYSGKGGGNPRLARAIFNKQEDLDLFLDLIEKHLR